MLDAFGRGPALRARPALPARIGKLVGKAVKPRLSGFQGGDDGGELLIQRETGDQRKRGGAGASTTGAPATLNFAWRVASELVPTKTVNVPGSTTRRIDRS